MKKRILALVLACAVLAASACDNSGGGDTTSTSDTTTGTTEAPDTSTQHGGDASKQYEWGNVEIVGGGYVVGLYYNASEEGLMYARTDIGGAYRMDKDTGRWKPLTDRFNEDDYTYYGIDGLATDENEPNRVYLLAGMYKGWKAAVLCSDDYGETWEITPLEFACGGNEPNRYADRLMLDPNDSKTLYVGSRTNGLWVSHDYGASFTKVESFPTLGLSYTEDNYNFGITAIAFDESSSEKGEPCKTIYVGTGDQEVFVTHDGGTTWESLKGQPEGYLPVHIYTENGLVYTVYNSKAGPYQVNDGKIMTYNPKNGEWGEITPESSGHGWGDLEFDPKNTEIMYASTMGKWGAEENDNMFRSADGGKTWSPLFTGDGQNKIFEMDYSDAPWLDWGVGHAKLGWMIGDLEVNPFNSDEIIYGTGATVYASQNLTKWGEETVIFDVRCEGIEETAIMDLEAANSDDIRLYSAMGDIDGFAHLDVDKVPETLNQKGIMTTSRCISAAYNNPLVVARTGDGNNPIAISVDGGVKWLARNKPEGVKGDCGKIEVNCDGSVIYWTNKTSAAIYKTTDNGKTWTKLEKTFANAQLIADCYNPDVLSVYTGGSLYVSKDGGATFKKSSAFIPDGCYVEADPEKEGSLWLATSFGGVFRLGDYGQGELARTSINGAECIAVGAPKDENSPMTLYVIGTCEDVYGVWRSTDSGETWQRINDDNHQFGSVGESIAADQRVFGQVYFGTNGRGIIMGRLK